MFPNPINSIPPILTLTLFLLTVTTRTTTAAPTFTDNRKIPRAAALGPSPITLTVHSFHAYIPHDRNAPSEVQFHLSDRRPKYALETDCSIYGPAIYLDKFTNCGNKEASFRLSEGELVVRRAWVQEGGMYVRGDAPQGTYWGEGGNKTVGEQGVTYSRPTEWEFTIKSMW